VVPSPSPPPEPEPLSSSSSSSPQQVPGQASVVGDPDEDELLEEIVELPPIDDGEDVLASSDDVFCWTPSFHDDCAADDPWSYEPNAWMTQAGGGIAAHHVDEMVVPGTGFATDQLWTTTQPDGIMPSGLGAFLWNL
jgi:EREBP-like factor